MLELVSDHPIPEPAEHELLARNRPTSVNPIDCAVRSGYGAGEVVAVGAGVTQFKPGDRIWASVLYGASAELVSVPEGLHASPGPTAGTALAVCSASTRGNFTDRKWHRRAMSAGWVTGPRYLYRQRRDECGT